jgi:hypothetical protein
MNSSHAAHAEASFARLAVICFSGFALGIALMHGLRPDFAPASHMISDYAVGPWGGVMTAAFTSAGVGCLLLAMGMAQGRPASVWGWLMAVLFAIVAAGLFVTAVFPTDLPAAPRTRSGEIHEISFMINVGGVVVAALAAVVLSWRDPRWYAYRRVGIVFAGLLVFALVVQFKTLHRGMPYGLANRFFVTILIGWFISIAFAIQRPRPVR